MPFDPEKIKSAREALDLSQAECAKRADMPQPNWARIESGERDDPRLSTAEKVAHAVKKPLHTLLRK